MPSVSQQESRIPNHMAGPVQCSTDLCYVQLSDRWIVDWIGL